MVSGKTARSHNLAIRPITERNHDTKFSGNTPHDAAFPQGSPAHCKTNEAAEWLALHRDELPDPIIPAVRDRFGLSNVDAIDALRRGRILRWARAN